ncbi:hypothetical protein NDU88_008268 [Pleurodeles waltl]|uniref:Uncharacterized protein n=1 Tax=Pleurodeles waltl TaxID=8319 RepID=A0AAV7PRE5_PLEWA|nr:hypothetical protein NDU88_008268 [Pleurodeles waltl]
MKVYEESQQIGKYLAWTTRTKYEKQTIRQIQDPDTSTIVTENEDIARVFITHYSRIYEADYTVSLAQLEQYYKSNKLPKISLKVQNNIVQKITPSKIKGAIQKMPSAKACGGDGFPDEFYKTFCEELAPFLTVLYNAIFGEQ